MSVLMPCQRTKNVSLERVLIGWRRKRLLEQTGLLVQSQAEGEKGPRVPQWQAREWRTRGATLTVWVDGPGKKRHGRLERRELWALSDPELNGYAGEFGSGGGGLAASPAGMPAGAAVDGEGAEPGDGKLCAHQSARHRRRS